MGNADNIVTVVHWLKPMFATMIASIDEAYFFQMAEVWWFLHQEHLVLPLAKVVAEP
jgi:hypothetical protein